MLINENKAPIFIVSWLIVNERKSTMTKSEPGLRVAPLAVRPKLHQHADLRSGVGALGVGHAHWNGRASGGYAAGSSSLLTRAAKRNAKCRGVITLEGGARDVT